MRVRTSRIVVVLLLAGMTLLLANCHRLVTFAANVPGYFGAFDRHADIPYDARPRARLDIYSPKDARRRPVIIFWYGGLWVEGSRAQFRFVGAALARAGYVAVLPDYRLYPEVKFPGFVEDGASAVRWVHEHIDEYGGDPQAVFLMGHSAGAHIAALIALDDRYLQARGGSSQWIRGLIGLSGPYAIDSQQSDTSVGICAARVGCARLLSAIFAAPYSPQDWQPASVMSSHQPPPTLLLHGAEDALVAVRHSELLRDRIAAREGRVELRVYLDNDHTDPILGFSMPSSSASSAMKDIRRFVQTHAPHVDVAP